jgi:hypothetical protein
MEKGYKRCPRCLGLKYMYKIGNGYSAVDSGGPKCDCPMCLGKGTIKSLEETIKDIQETKEKRFYKNKKGGKDDSPCDGRNTANCS